MGFSHKIFLLTNPVKHSKKHGFGPVNKCCKWDAKAPVSVGHVALQPLIHLWD